MIGLEPIADYCQPLLTVRGRPRILITTSFLTLVGTTRDQNQRPKAYGARDETVYRLARTRRQTRAKTPCSRQETTGFLADKRDQPPISTETGGDLFYVSDRTRLRSDRLAASGPVRSERQRRLTARPSTSLSPTTIVTGTLSVSAILIL